MWLKIQPQLQNTTLNSTNSTVSGHADYFGFCDDMMVGVMIWAVLSVVCFLFGFPACVTILWELLQRHRKGIPTTPNDVFMLNLTVMDLVFLGFLPLRLCNSFIWHNMTLENICIFIQALSMGGRPLLMTCICLDCYLAVVHPIKYRTTKGLTSRVLMCVGVWVVTVTYGTFCVVSDKGMWITSPVIILCAVTVLTIGLCDFFILRALMRSDPGGRDLHPQKKKALQIIVNSLVMTFFSYLPPMLVLSFHSLMPISNKVFICSVFIPIILTTIVGSAVMPVLYLVNLGRLGWLRCWRGA